MVRVVLAEDNVLLREGLARVLQGARDLELAGTYGDYDALLAGVADVNPDVVVTDIRMPPGHDDEGSGPPPPCGPPIPTSVSWCSPNMPALATPWRC